MDVVLLNPGLAELPDNYTGLLLVQFGVGYGHSVRQMPYSCERLVWGVAGGKDFVNLYKDKSVVAEVDADLETNKDGLNIDDYEWEPIDYEWAPQEDLGMFMTSGGGIWHGAGFKDMGYSCVILSCKDE